MLPAAPEPQRAIVTGGAGFLGSHLCERLLARGDHVLCLDDLSTGTRENVARLATHPRYRFEQHDVAEPYTHPADRIYNLASPASPPHYQRDPIRTLRTNVYGAMNALDLADQTGATILQASTSEVYGDPTEHPQREGYWGNVNPIGPRACYDEGKRAAEALFTDYHRQRGTRIKIARIFNTYGPHMRPDDGRVVTTFIAQALRGEPLTVYGDGNQTRSFCYVDDLVSGLIRLMDSPHTITGPINLGNPTEHTIAELAATIQRLVDRAEPREERWPLPPDDPRRRKPDITLARGLLDWEPLIPLRVGLARTIAHFPPV